MEKYKVTIEDRVYEVTVEPLEVGVSDQQKPNELDSTPSPESKPAAPNVSGTKVEAPLAGSVLSVNVKVGDQVNEGDVLLTLEALKLENEITSPTSGKVVEVVSAGNTVETGQTLAVIS